MRSRDSLKYFASALAHTELNSRRLAPPPALSANPECEIDSSTSRAAVPMLTLHLLLGVVDAQAARHIRPEPRGLHRRLVTHAKRANQRASVRGGAKAFDRDWDVGEVGDLSKVGNTAQVERAEPRGRARHDLADAARRELRIAEREDAIATAARRTINPGDVPFE